MPAAEPLPFRSLVFRSLGSAAVCALIFVGCYLWIDRPLAEFVFRQKPHHYAWVKWLTYPPPVVQTWSPLVLVLLTMRLALGPWKLCGRTLFLALVSLVLADQFHQSLQIVFGRDWPETWIDNNPSLIGSGAYGFHWFRGNEEFGSFPSGHAARTFAFLAPWWIAYPTFRWLYAIVAAAICFGLIAMNYHFLGDVIVGAYLGALVGTWGSALIIQALDLQESGGNKGIEKVSRVKEK